MHTKWTKDIKVSSVRWNHYFERDLLYFKVKFFLFMGPSTYPLKYKNATYVFCQYLLKYNSHQLFAQRRTNRLFVLHQGS